MSSLPPPPPPPRAVPAPLAPPPGSGEWGVSPEEWSRLLAPPPPAPPWWLAPLATWIVALLVAAGATFVVRSGPDGPDHPEAWDPRVADLADFVEAERGHAFDHPVYVDFLTAAEYTAATTEDDVGVSEGAERAELERYAGQLRALGVASGELDLYEAFNSVVDSGTLAFYDPVSDRIRVRGTEMTVGLEVTIVHELTHALQDQTFDLGRLSDPSVDPGAAAAFRGVSEGDALRVENAYIDGELTPSERTDYDEEFAQDLADSEAATRNVPAFLEATFGAPYALGQPLVTMLYNQDGNDGVDGAFRRPPSTEEQLLDPASFLDREGSTTVEVDLADGVEPFEEGTFGATAWYLFLAERIDPKLAFDAALGWAGDGYAAFERDDRVCLRAVFAGDRRDDEVEMEGALRAWVDTMVGDQAELLDVDGRPGIETCDPGPDTDLELTGRSETSLYLPNLWGYLVADAAVRLDADGCRCYARTVLAELTFEEITDPEGEVFQGAPFRQLLERAFSACD